MRRREFIERVAATAVGTRLAGESETAAAAPQTEDSAHEFDTGFWPTTISESPTGGRFPNSFSKPRNMGTSFS